MILVLTEILKISHFSMVTKYTQHFRLDLPQSPGGKKGDTRSGGPDRNSKSHFLPGVKHLKQWGFFTAWDDGQCTNFSHSYSYYSHAYRMDRTIMVTCPTLIMHEITTPHHPLKAAENHCQLWPVWQVWQGCQAYTLVILQHMETHVCGIPIHHCYLHPHPTLQQQGTGPSHKWPGCPTLLHHNTLCPRHSQQLWDEELLPHMYNNC